MNHGMRRLAAASLLALGISIGVKGALDATYAAPLSQTQATASPVGTATIANFRSINMTAARVGGDMVVNLTATGFPARTALVVSLAVPNGGGELQVATGTTDARGSGALTFKMPATWPNGEPVSENAVLVTVKTADGSVKVAATLTFVRAGR
ncbi:MAG TPA: hypothetical protein VER55_11560 [Ardenticatenaceae bacterium]|nr:hypothetical protein [Ardenticatenaceae bacterium]